MTGYIDDASLTTCMFKSTGSSSSSNGGSGGNSVSDGTSGSNGNTGDSSNRGNTGSSSAAGSTTCQHGFQHGQQLGGTQGKLAAKYTTADRCKEAVRAQCTDANGATLSN